jgi:diguanylate cyclase (GGDEF)-like protein/PAS domain S-box-containing protein
MTDNTRLFSEKEHEQRQTAPYWEKDLPGDLKEIFGMSHIGLWRWDEKQQNLFWNSEFYRILGLDSEKDKPSLELYLSHISDNDRDKVKGKIRQAVRTASSINFDHRIITSENRDRYICLWGKIHRCPETGKRYGSGMIQDITPHKTRPIIHDFPLDIFESNLVGVVVTDANANITFINQAFTTITGYGKKEALGENPRILKSNRHDDKFYEKMWQKLISEDYWEGEIWNRRKNREVYPEWLTIRTIRNYEGNIVRFVSHFVDLSEQRHKDVQIEKYSFSDVLTGSGNKEMFFINLDSEIKKSEIDNSSFAVAALDINRFKSVNESLGYVAGDQLLQLATQRIQRVIGKKDYLARFGGDDFFILFSNIQDTKSLKPVIKAIIEKFRKPFTISGINYFLSVSIGISCYPTDTREKDELISLAERAIRKAKERGSNNYVFFSRDFWERSIDYLVIESQLRSALESPEMEFRTRFQPKLDLVSGDINGFEALVRWEHPERGMLPPDEFIPVAEETGLVVYMDMWMFQEACRLSVEWEKTLGRPVRIAVNFASRQYYRSNLVSSLREILDKTGARPENIGIEITETGIMTDFERATTILSELKKTGFSLNIDDFGTGYSSLAYLRQFPVDALKIDKSFIDHILTDQQTAVLVKTIITMAHSLGMKVIAEGVESILQKKFLEENRCDLIQGYLVSKPIPTDKVIDFLNTYSSS